MPRPDNDDDDDSDDEGVFSRALVPGVGRPLRKKQTGGISPAR
jgi:hypothetical protein